MANESKRNLGITGKLKLMGVRTELWIGGFRFTLSYTDGSFRTFSYGFAERAWTELTPGGPSTVSEKIVAEFVESSFAAR
jgi:hypothetical protein